ncbi:hypothetical protein ACET3Z_030076 [Daucus carota]
MITKWIRDEKSEVSVWVGEMPLCRQVPKLRGNAGVNLKDIAAAGVQEGEEVSLESLENKDLINPSGRQTKETSFEDSRRWGPKHKAELQGACLFSCSQNAIRSY